MNWDAYKDQFGAAADHSESIMEFSRALAVADGGSVKTTLGNLPDWLVFNVISTVTSWATGKGKTCSHSPSVTKPQPVFAAAWKPDLVVCSSCTHLLRLRKGSEADLRCDLCGTIDPNVTTGQFQAGPMVYMAGYCLGCLPDGVR